MLGTIVNTCTIIVGSVLGAAMHRGVKEKYCVILYDGLGLVSLAIGLNAAVNNLPKSTFPVLFIVSIALGGVIGTWIDIDKRFSRLVDQYSARPGERNKLSQGLSAAILLYCVGPLSMLGPLSALSPSQGWAIGESANTFLYTNATLDLVTSAVLAASFGRIMLLAAPVLFCWQGMFYAITKVSSSAISDQLMTELLIVGGLLITGSGLALLNIKNVKTLNFLPALLVPVIWFLLKSFL